MHSTLIFDPHAPIRLTLTRVWLSYVMCVRYVISTSN